jgi:GNAT superfamily N-acetyltransferase
MSSDLTIRNATPDDAGVILSFIRALADYEKLSGQVTATEDDLRSSLFGERTVAEVLLAHEGKIPVGFALFFHNYSTFLGKPGIYLEDLFVKSEYRNKGYGKALLVHLARLANQRGCGRFEWSVLDWNTPSIEFYRGLGARPLDEWTLFRLDGDALTNFGTGLDPTDKRRSSEKHRGRGQIDQRARGCFNRAPARGTRRVF